MGPNASSTRRASSVGSGAAPDMSQRSDEVSYLRSTSGPTAMRRDSIVGTTVIDVMRSRSMVRRICSGSKCRTMTLQPPTMKIMLTNAAPIE